MQQSSKSEWTTTEHSTLGFHYLVCINHGIKESTANVFQRIGMHIKTNGAIEKHAAKLKE